MKPKPRVQTVDEVLQTWAFIDLPSFKTPSSADVTGKRGDESWCVFLVDKAFAAVHTQYPVPRELCERRIRDFFRDRVGERVLGRLPWYTPFRIQVSLLIDANPFEIWVLTDPEANSEKDDPPFPSEDDQMAIWESRRDAVLKSLQRIKKKYA